MKKTTAQKTKFLRYMLIGLMVFFAAGGISLYFLVQLGAAVFEIDPVLIGLPAGLAYLIFSIFVYLPLILFKDGTSMIALCPFSKKEETIQFIFECVSAVIGTVIILIAQHNESMRILLCTAGFLFFYMPGLLFRFVFMMIKLSGQIKKIIPICIVFSVFIIAPVAVATSGIAQENYGLGYFALLYILPLIALLTVGHDEDNLKDESDAEALKQNQADQTNI